MYCILLVKDRLVKYTKEEENTLDRFVKSDFI